MNQILVIFILSVPLIFGGIIHMVVVKANVLSYLNKPVHQRLFGLNKTWRGFIIMPLATWPGVLFAQVLEASLDIKTMVLADQSSFKLAVLLGIGYCVAELPNSFLKRRLGIKEGKTSDHFKWFFVILDQADSAIGCLLAYRLVLPISSDIFYLTVLFGTVVHLLINVLLYQLGIRKNPY